MASAENRSELRVVIGGDVVPMARATADFVAGNAENIWGGYLQTIKEADLAVVNLECPLADAQSPIPKVGRNFIAPTGAIMGFEKAGIDVLSLANNHILDQGQAGLESTLKTCSEHGVKTVGAGVNIDEAARPLTLDFNGRNLVVFSSAESEFSIAGRARGGANPISAIDISRSYRQIPKDAFTIHLLHSGREHYRYPSPKLHKLARFVVEQGAKVVLCQHSHCAGTYEEYEGGLIVYGQGNLAFDKFPKAGPSWCEGFLVSLRIGAADEFDFEFLPYVQYAENASVREMDDGQRGEFLNALADRSRPLADPDEITRLWEDHCRAYKHKYMSILRGHGDAMKSINKSLHLTDFLYRKHPLRYLLNTVRCETHKEILETILKMEQ